MTAATGPGSQGGALYRTVLVGTDGSETARAAVSHAGGLATALGASLTVVSAFTPTSSAPTVEGRPEGAGSEGPAPGADTFDRVREDADLARQTGAPEVLTYVAAGDPAEVLIQHAIDADADVIVVGSAGMRAVPHAPDRAPLGSVPNNVSHHAPCDVLIVRTAG